jgi:hypothetical protein
MHAVIANAALAECGNLLQVTPFVGVFTNKSLKLLPLARVCNACLLFLINYILRVVLKNYFTSFITQPPKNLQYPTGK